MHLYLISPHTQKLLTVPLKSPNADFDQSLIDWVQAAPFSEMRAIASGRIRDAFTHSSPKLDLSDLGLSTLPSALIFLTECREINISKNRFTTLPPELEKMPQIRQLSASHNEIEAIPPFIRSFTQLQELDLSFNKITCLPSEMAFLSQLWSFNISNNLLTVIPRVVGSLKNIRSLVACNNKVHTISRGVSHLRNILLFNVNDNQIASFPAEIDFLPAHGVRYYNNPLPVHVGARKMKKHPWSLLILWDTDLRFYSPSIPLPPHLEDKAKEYEKLAQVLQRILIDTHVDIAKFQELVIERNEDEIRMMALFFIKFSELEEQGLRIHQLVQMIHLCRKPEGTLFLQKMMDIITEWHLSKTPSLEESFCMIVEESLALDLPSFLSKLSLPKENELSNSLPQQEEIKE